MHQCKRNSNDGNRKNAESWEAKLLSVSPAEPQRERMSVPDDAHIQPHGQRKQGWESRLPGFESQSHAVALWPWGSYYASVCLTFLVGDVDNSDTYLSSADVRFQWIHERVAQGLVPRGHMRNHGPSVFSQHQLITIFSSFSGPGNSGVGIRYEQN